MAIYHLSMKIISRGNGQNAVASAAYRSGEELVDEQDGTKKFYERSVLPETHILAPSNSPKWVFDRQKLWNNVERSENRVNSRLSRELEIALPLELSNQEQTNLLKEFIQDNCVNKGMIADIGIHRDHPENPHAHVMLTTREITRNGFGEKNRSWNNVEYLEHTRKRWAELCNKYLEKNNSMERIDHRSYKDQGLDLIPTEHVGVKGKTAERQGIELRNDVLRRNAIAKEYNQKIILLQEKREQYLNEGLTEHTKNPDNLVVTYRMYMDNQKALRVGYNKLNYYESKLKKEGSLSLFEREQFEKAQRQIQENGKLKHDYLSHVDKFLNSENGLFVNFANKYGQAQADKLTKQLVDSGKTISPSMQKYIERSAVRFSEEMKIRFADTIKQLGTSNAKTIVESVEKQLHTESARRIVKGWINHENVTLEVRKLKNELENYKQSNRKSVDKQTIKLIKDISSLEHVKQFYEVQAIHGLQEKGFYDLVEKYNTEKAQSAIVGMYDELVKHPEIKSARELETQTFNNFKLRRVQNIVRGELSGVNISKRLDSLKQWETIQERSITNLKKDVQIPDVVQKLAEKSQRLKETKQSIQLVAEGVKILDARATHYLAKHPELKNRLEQFDLSSSVRFSDRMSLDFKKQANYHLFVDTKPVYNSTDLLTKMYDNVLDYKEYTVEKEAKNVLYRHEYESYQAILGNIDEAVRKRDVLQEGLATAQKRVDNHMEILKNFEEKWTAKEELERSKFVRGKAEKLSSINEWLVENNVTAHTKSGALNQLNYQYKQASSQVIKHKELDRIKIPALENMKFITESKAIRTVEKDFTLKAGFQYQTTLPDTQKEVFIAYAELKKNLGVEHLDTQKLEQKIGTYTEQYKQAQNTLKSTQELLQEKEQMRGFLDRSTQRRMSTFKESLATQPETINQSKEAIEKLSTFRKTELTRMDKEIKELRTTEKAQRASASAKSQAVNLAKEFKTMLSGYKNQVSEAEMNQARKQRLKALQKDRGMELELERERK